jgi:hypothetical protein
MSRSEVAVTRAFRAQQRASPRNEVRDEKVNAPLILLSY